MTPRRRFSVLLTLVALLLPPAGTLAQQDPKPPTTTPTTAPAPSPKAVALAYLAAIDKADAPAALAMLPAGPQTAQWVQASINLSAALKKLDAEALAKFGEEVKSISQNQLHLADTAKMLESAAEKIEGEAATLTCEEQASPLRLMRVGGKWLLQIIPSPEIATRQVALNQRLTAAATRTAEEIKAGKYAGPEAARKAFMSRVLDARAGL